MSATVIVYELLNRVAGEEGFLWQYDYGQKMKLIGIDLPSAYTVHFSNSSRGASIPSIGDSTGVGIPDQVLMTGKPVYFWLFLHVGENDGQTAYGNTISVHPRAELPTIEPPSPEQQSILDELMAALNAGIGHVDDVAEGIPAVVDAEIQAAKDRGEFKGDPGAVFTPSMQDGIMTWTNDGGLPNPAPTNFHTELGLDNFATKQELAGKVDNGRVGQPNGVAALDATGHVPSELLPSYVDDVLEFPSVSQFPAIGESSKIYISTSNNHWYRWTGSQYIDMTGADANNKADKRDTILETTLSRGRKDNADVGVASLAFGDNVEASGVYSQAFGQNTTASGGAAHAEGYGAGALGNISHAEGYNTRATGLDSHAEGAATQATADYAHSEGYYTVAQGNSSHAEGSLTTASGLDAHSEGRDTVASGNFSHAEGLGGTFQIAGDSYRSGALGHYSHSEGDVTSASGEGAHSEGFQTVASGNFGHTEGYQTKASGNISHAEGYSSMASGYCAHAEGSTAKATQDYAHAEGSNTTASGNGSHAEGISSNATGYASHAEGYSTTASVSYAHAEGDSTTASGSRSHAEGGNTTASGSYTHAEGLWAVSSGYASHAEGSYTESDGDASHAEGASTHATGSRSHAEGYNTTASGYQSHSEGSGTEAAGDQAHAEGGGTAALGNYAHAEGSGTTASGDYSHAEGAGTTASGNYSHAEGASSISSGSFSHAEGGGNYAVGNYAHVEGSGCQAIGDNSHAQGGGTSATGNYSHAEGGGTIASGRFEHVSGMSNVEDTYDNVRWPEWVPGEHCMPGDKRKRTRIINEETVIEGFVCKTENTDSDWVASHWDDMFGRMNYAVVVGNGYAGERSNAYSLDWEGNGYYAGDLYVGCNPDGTGGVKLEPVVFATDAQTRSIFASA